MSTNPSIDQTLVERLRDERKRTPFEPWARELMKEAANAIETLLASTSAGQGEAIPAGSETREAELLNDIGVMMSEFVDNWPEPRKVSTALALVAKTMRAALDGTAQARGAGWDAGRNAAVDVANRHVDLQLCRRLFGDQARGAFGMASHLRDDINSMANEADRLAAVETDAWTAGD